MCKLLEIKYYTVLVMYTFPLQPVSGAKKNGLPRRTLAILKYFKIKCSA